MRRFALILMLWPGILTAGEFKKLTGEEIGQALLGRTLEYGDGVSQIFDTSMLTQYFADPPRAGKWTVREDQYCSAWPHSGSLSWSCYDVYQSGGTIRFIDGSGTMTDGTYSE